MDEWTPIELIENKEDERSILLLNEGFPIVGYWETDHWAENCECRQLHNVTHFCEIPKKPEGA